MSDKETEPKPKRTIFILYIPGGAILGLIPSMMLERLEELTETPTGHLFQVVDGVSTGSILAAGMGVRDKEDPTKPKISSKEMSKLFRRIGPKIFPDIKGRQAKLVTSNLLNFVEDNLDPTRVERGVLNRINKACNALSESITDEEQKKTFIKLREVITSRWLTKSNKTYGLKLCGQLREANESLAKNIDHISGLFSLRPETGVLSRVFRQSAVGGAKLVKKAWAKNYMFDAEVPKKYFRKFFGENRLDESLLSIYISTYDLKNNRRYTFFSRKKDFFSTDPNTPSVTSKNNNKIWDTVMASVANPFAFPPHLTEDGLLCSDKAPVHTPFTSVLDVMKNKPDDADVKLVIMGCGTHLNKNLEDDDDDLETMAQDINRLGMIGNLARGKELAHITNYVMSGARAATRQMLGENNIVEFNPPLAPRSDAEQDQVPDRDVLNGTPENIDKIENRTKQYIEENDQEFRKLSLTLIENLRNIGRMDDAKYKRVKAEITSGIKDPSCLKENGNDQDDSDQQQGVHAVFDSLEGTMFDVAPAEEQDNDPEAEDKPKDKKDDKKNGTDKGPKGPTP